MKSSIAAFVTACERLLVQNKEFSGSVALLLTSDEEGPSVDGVRRVMEHLTSCGEHIHYCLVGEPTAEQRLGDTVKIGRRGSLSGKLIVHGQQGHVAYPQQARNAVHEALPALLELSNRRWDQGNDIFPPTTFQISNINAGLGVGNVIPGEAIIDFNFRFSPAHTYDTLVAAVDQVLQANKLRYDLEFHLSAQPFASKQGKLIDAVVAAIKKMFNITPKKTASGGTSDARFVAPSGAEVVELGPLNRTIHCINEEIAIHDLEQLSLLYESILRHLVVIE